MSADAQRHALFFVFQMSNQSLTVFKEVSGRYRWVLLSSNAYRDRHAEIVSTKALEIDCDRADSDGDYGPLRWWHVGGLDIGDCDFNAMHGRMLIESGTFRNPAVAERVKEQAPDLAVSIAFRHPLTEPDSDGVFHTIRRFERSLLPKGREGNALCQVGFVTKEVEESNMKKEKLDAFKQLVGEDTAKEILAQAETTQKQADNAGTAFKEKAKPSTHSDAETPAEDKTETPADEMTEDKTGKPFTKKEAGQTIGELTVPEFAAVIATAFKEAFKELGETAKELTTSSGKVTEALTGFDKRLKELEGDMPASAKTTVIQNDGNGGLSKAFEAALSDTLKEFGIGKAASNGHLPETDFMLPSAKK